MQNKPFQMNSRMVLMRVLLLNFVVLSLFVSFLHGVAAADYTFTLVSDDLDGKAKCMDGSLPSYYIRPNPSSQKWFIFFKGGGWCVSDEDCYQRSLTALGSSTAPQPVFEPQGIYASNCSTATSAFCDFNLVYINYCDGTSWASMRESPLVVNGTNVWFRGRFNLEAVFHDLSTNYQYDAATSVLVGGSSAGGVAASLHANFIQSELLPAGVGVFGVLSASGWIPDHPNENTPPQDVIGANVQYLWNVGNLTGGVDQSCVAAAPSGSEWRCFFSPDVYDFVKAPMYIVNAVYDAYQTPCVLATEPAKPGTVWKNGMCQDLLPDWQSCVQAPHSSCSASQLTILNSYAAWLTKLLQSSANFDKPGNGGFLHSCYTHGAVVHPTYFTIASSDGSTTLLSDAVNAWWASLAPLGAVQPAARWELPCAWSATGAACNPSCGAMARRKENKKKQH